MQVIQELLDFKLVELKKVLTAYRSKLDNRNELLVRGRCNFVSTVIERIHSNLLLTKPSVTAVLDEHFKIRDKILTMESAFEIEDILVDLLNEMAESNLEGFKNEIDSNMPTLKKLLIKKDCSINDMFQFLFGITSDKNLMDNIFDLIKGVITFQKEKLNAGIFLFFTSQVFLPFFVSNL
jgi:hypothetical protein